MDQQQQPHCPSCGKFVSVRRKLLVAPWAIEPPQVGSGHLSVHQTNEESPRHVRGDFINGFYCDSCESGFVTEEVLREVGLSEHEIRTERYCFTRPRGTWKL